MTTVTGTNGSRAGRRRSTHTVHTNRHPMTKIASVRPRNATINNPARANGDDRRRMATASNPAYASAVMPDSSPLTKILSTAGLPPTSASSTATVAVHRRRLGSSTARQPSMASPRMPLTTHSVAAHNASWSTSSARTAASPESPRANGMVQMSCQSG